MPFRAFFLGVACVASACHSAVPSGEQRAEELVKLAQAHLGVYDLNQSIGKGFGKARSNLTEVSYDTPELRRFATYYLTPEKSLREFVVNQPDAEPYMPIRNRAAFIERVMEIAAPESSKAERTWGAKQLDSLWKKPLNPLPVQVGGYVFSGITSTHDTLRIVAADTGASGLKYRPQP